MEKGELSLDKYLVKPTLTPEDIKKIIFSIYCDLYELSSLTIREGDISTLLKFKHGDFKCNNLVVSKNGVPLIIDFGLSRFTLTDAGKSIEFISCEPGTDKYYRRNGYNIIHDMLQLIASLNMVKKELVVKPFEILKFINNKNSNILDTDVIMREMTFQFPGVYLGAAPLFQLFYDEFDLENLIESDDYEKYTIEITPEELAYNIGLTVEDRIIDQFEYKYKKYKTKYLNLKISSRAVLMRY